MTIPLTGTGGLFTRLGTLGGLLNGVNAFRGTANLTAASIKSVGSAVDAIAAQFNSADQNLTGGLYAQRDGYRAVHSTLTQYLRQLAQQVLVQMANDDSPLSQQTLPQALALLISQMKGASASVKKPTVSATATAGGSNVGGGALTASVLAGSGTQLDYALNESVTATCTLDAQTSGIAGQEQFSLTAPAAESDALMWDWPLGSGINTGLRAVDALQDATAGQVLQNGSFKTFTNTNQPDNWVVDVATIGTTVLKATGGNVYKGASGLAYVGDGAQLTGLYQPFGTNPSTTINTGGTAYAPLPSTSYAVSLRLKVSSVPAAGVLEVALTDGSGTITQDAAGTNNSFTKSLPAATTSFTSLTGFFRTPAVLPATGLRLRLKLTTALDNAKTLYLGHLAVTPAVPLYAGGPLVALFSGSPDFIAGDTLTAAVSNAYDSAWQKLADRFFSMRSLGLQLPSAGSPTVNDNLIA